MRLLPGPGRLAPSGHLQVSGARPARPGRGTCRQRCPGGGTGCLQAVNAHPQGCAGGAVPPDFIGGLGMVGWNTPRWRSRALGAGSGACPTLRPSPHRPTLVAAATDRCLHFLQD